MSIPAHFAPLRQLLEQRRGSLRHEIHAVDASALEQINSAATHDVTDRKEVAGQLLATDLQGAEVQRDVANSRTWKRRCSAWTRAPMATASTAAT